jgi:hypothetical protein
VNATAAARTRRLTPTSCAQHSRASTATTSECGINMLRSLKVGHYVGGHKAYAHKTWPLQQTHTMHRHAYVHTRIALP